MNNYELILIFDPNFGEEKTGAMVGKVEEKIKALGGEIEKVDKWGVRRLASMMKKAKAMTQGCYVLVRAVVVLPGTSSKRTAPGAAPAAPEAVEIGEIKGKPLGESQ